MLTNWMRYATKLSFFLLFACAFARPCKAQIVNVLPGLNVDKLGWSGTFASTCAWRTGNNQIFDLSGESQVRYRRVQDVVYWIGRARYVGGGNNPFISQAFEHWRYRRILSDHFSAEIFLQQEYDSFRRLNLRALQGFGPRLALYTSDDYDVAIGTSYMFEYERLNDVHGSAHSSNIDSRSSSYAQFTWRANEQTTLQQVIYAQPLFTNIHDVRSLAESSVIVKGSPIIAFKMALRLMYDSRPPSTVKPMDTALETSIMFTP